jgi:hypothetical protein
VTYWKLVCVVILGLYAAVQVVWALRDKGSGPLIRIVIAALAGSGAYVLANN